jgi:hypothetical protein
MKKLLVIIFLLGCEIAVAQTYPSEFKIAKDVYSKFKPVNKKDIPNNPGRFSVTPNSSPTIISNFISDIITVSNPNGDTIWFGTGKGLSRTINRGASFENFYGTAPFGEDDVSGIAV